MNRQLRRIASRQKYIAPPRVVPLPSLFDEWAVFNGITSILQKLERGEIEAANGIPVFQDEKGQWCEVCPALSGWISVLERYDRTFSLGLVQDPLAKLQNKLLYSMPLTPAMLPAPKRCWTSSANCSAILQQTGFTG